MFRKKGKTSYLCFFSLEWGDQIFHKMFHSIKIWWCNTAWAIQQKCNVCLNTTVCSEEEMITIWVVIVVSYGYFVCALVPLLGRLSCISHQINHSSWQGTKMLRLSDCSVQVGLVINVCSYMQIFFNSAFKIMQDSTYLPSIEEGTGFSTRIEGFISTHTPLYVVILLQSFGIVGPHAWKRHRQT